jgi:hypothetical protein
VEISQDCHLSCWAPIFAPNVIHMEMKFLDHIDAYIGYLTVVYCCSWSSMGRLCQVSSRGGRTLVLRVQSRLGKSFLVLANHGRINRFFSIGLMRREISNASVILEA